MATTKTRGSNQIFWDADIDFNAKKITNLAAPTSANDAANKDYVDARAAGLDPKGSVRVATAAALPACTPAGSGVGKTLTMNAVGVLTIDGVATVLNNRILVKNQAAGADNGIYKVTTEGTAGVAAVLTRATDADSDAEVTAGMWATAEEGTANADNSFILTTNNPITVDTTALVFALFQTLTIADGSVTNAKLADMATKTYKGRTTAGTGVPEDVAVATLKTDLILVKADVGLGNVDNTSDAAKPVSTATQTALDLKLTITNYAVRETPSGTLNGSNVTFTLAFTPVSGTEMLFLNGILQNAGAGNDYTISTVTITMAVAPISTDKMLVTYLK